MAQKIQRKYIGSKAVGSDQILLDKNTALKIVNESDAEVDLIKLNSSDEVQFSGSLDLQSLSIKNMADGVDAQDAVSKSQLDGKLDASLLGAANGIAELDANGLIPTAQLPFSVEDAIANGVIDKAPSQNAVFDALALKQDSLGTGTTSQYLRGDLTWDGDLVSRISAMEGYKQEHVYVDHVAGVDAVGRGSFMQPFKTINYAYSQVPSLGNPTNTSYNAQVGQFVTEKLVINLAPGRYTENVVLGFKRARVQIVGNGSTIIGDVKMSVKLADFPASNLENLKANFPTPYTGGSAFMNFELTGQCGGGLESDPTGNVLVVTGQAVLAFEESTVSGGPGALPNWDQSYGQFYIYVNTASVGNLCVTTSYTTDLTKALPAGVIEVESCNIASTASTYRMFTGIVPYTYLTDFANWNTTNKGTTNKVPSGTWSLKAHNSTFGNVIGPRLTIGEMDGCRIYDIDRTMRGTVDNGAISGSTSTSYIGFVNNQFRIYSGSGDLASAYKIGQASGTTRYKIDSVSYTTLAFSRNSSGLLTARTLDVGAGVNYDLLDDARSVFVNDPANNYTRSANTVDAALEGIDAALALKINATLKGAVNGLAELDSSGKIPASQLPSITITDTYVVTSQAAMLALVVQTGDVAVRSDLSKSFILAGNDPSVLADWQELLSPTTGVNSVNGLTGSITLTSDDVNEGSTNQYFTAQRAKDAIVFEKEKIVLSASDVTNQYVDLPALINESSLIAFNMRLALHEDDDYTLSTVGEVTRLSFAGDSAIGGDSALAAGDILRFVYVLA